MKISARTLAVLKNYSSIVPYIVVKAGNVLRTTTGNKDIIAKASVDEVFPTDFAIFELSKFLAGVSLFDDPDFEFFEDHVKISEGKNVIRFTYADPVILGEQLDRDPKMPALDIEFDLTEKDLTSILKAASILQAEDLTVVGEDGTIYVRATNTKNSTADSFSIAVGVTSASFNMIFKVANLKFMPSDYHVGISAKGIAQFESSNATYWIAPQAKSTYGV